MTKTTRSRTMAAITLSASAWPAAGVCSARAGRSRRSADLRHRGGARGARRGDRRDRRGRAVALVLGRFSSALGGIRSRGWPGNNLSTWVNAVCCRQPSGAAEASLVVGGSGFASACPDAAVPCSSGDSSDEPPLMNRGGGGSEVTKPGDLSRSSTLTESARTSSLT